MEKTSKNEAIAWVRVQRNSKTGQYFYPLSFKDGRKGVLRIDNTKLQQVKQDSTLLNKQVVGTIFLSEAATTGKSSYKAAVVKSQAQTAQATVDTDDTPF